MCVELSLWLLKSKSLHKRVPVAVGTGQSRFLPDRVTAVPLWVQSPGLVSARSSILVRNMNVSQSGGVYPPWQWWMDGQPGVNVVLHPHSAMTWIFCQPFANPLTLKLYCFHIVSATDFIQTLNKTEKFELFFLCLIYIRYITDICWFH